MKIIEEHPFTQEEQIRQKGEEASKRIYFVYETILYIFFCVLVARIIWSFFRLLGRLFRYSNYRYSEWKKNRRVIKKRE